MRLTIERSQVQISLAPLINLSNFLYPTLPVSFGRSKTVGPFHLVSMPGKVKDHTQGVNLYKLSYTPYSTWSKVSTLRWSK